MTAANSSLQNKQNNIGSTSQNNMQYTRRHHFVFQLPRRRLYHEEKQKKMILDGEMGEAAAKSEMAKKSLIDYVFSWSLKAVLNKDLYKDKVEQIPLTFQSVSSYLESFVYPLIDETRAELCSSMDMVSSKPICEIVSIEAGDSDKPFKRLVYTIETPRQYEERDFPMYEPRNWDLFALTDIRPKSIDDLDRPTLPYLIALVRSVRSESEYVKMEILPSRSMLLEQDAKGHGVKGSLYAVFLINMATNIRIWNALNLGLEEWNTEIIEKVLQPNSSLAKDHCSLCLREGTYRLSSVKLQTMISSFSLNSSQKEAVSKCFVMKDCCHDNRVKLIWGPPGTGKTKTTAALLFAFLGHKCRTVTCAPTNIAVVEVTARLLRLFMDSNEYETYGLGDIVLFGNEERMQIIDHVELHTVYLDYRAKILAKCFAPTSGWKHCLDSVICLLEDPEKLYQLYLTNDQGKDDVAVCEGQDVNDLDQDGEEKNDSTIEELFSNQEKGEKLYTEGLENEENKRIWKHVITHTLNLAKDNKYWYDKRCDQKRNCCKFHSKGDREQHSNKKLDLNFDEFVKKKLKHKIQAIKYCILNLCAHLPTSFLSQGDVKDMRRALYMLEYLNCLLHSVTAVGGSLKEIFDRNTNKGLSANGITQFDVTRKECLQILRCLPKKFSDPEIHDERAVKNCILENACLFFCTASSSIRLHNTSLELLVVDEAAQLKECESTIPLQLPGLHHAILIGDERQLPAMVNSKICEKAKFGRSLFERLALTGYRKHLLDVQYRMHPSISLFPNKEFYQKQIVDAPNVKERSYEKHFLQGDMYGSYSFINVECGNEESHDGRSQRNMVEVAVVCELIANLYEEFTLFKKRISIGVISPYAAQVAAIKQILGTKYETDPANDFSVSVRSVDGFQGGEKDLIIISTVRCNSGGSIGFLSNIQRTNVALTRPRYCLWIFGNGATLKNSNSVWSKLVLDAKIRSCFYNAYDDKNLAKAMIAALIDIDLLDVKLKIDSLLPREMRFKVMINDNFWTSIAKINSIDIRKKALSMLVELSNGSFQTDNLGVHVINGMPASASQLYTVDGLLKIIWTADLHDANSNHIQVLKVWDVVLSPEDSDIAGHHKNVFENYSRELHRSEQNLIQRNSEVSVRQPRELGVLRENNLSNIDPLLLLCEKFAAITIKDEW